jgi:hypothetical protein
MNHRSTVTREQVKKRLAIPAGYRIPEDWEVLKQCSCGAVYRVHQWRQLPRAGVTDEMPDDGGPPVIDYRDCACKTTLAQASTRDGRILVRTGPYLQTIGELARVAERGGDVQIPASGIYSGKPVAARTLMAMRGTGLEVLFGLGIEVDNPPDREKESK